MRGGLLVLVLTTFPAFADEPAWLSSGQLRWSCSPPLLAADAKAIEPDVALKDPTLVFTDGRWHLFVTHRLVSGQVNMQYLSFKDWADAGRSPRHTLRLHDQYHCAPQVFYFTPHRKWYLIYQLADEQQPLRFGPSFSTTDDIADPASWTKPRRMIERLPEGGDETKWIDFWVICDAGRAHLFYTSDDGHFWRRETNKADFPFGWGKPALVLKDSKNALFEASHTYKIKGRDLYLTVIEAIGDHCRYYKAWLADRLEGPWRPLAASAQQPFAHAAVNVNPSGQAWTESISHGELVRSGNDEYLEIDPARLQFVFQGADRQGYTGQRYGSIPWKLGILEQENP